MGFNSGLKGLIVVRCIIPGRKVSTTHARWCSSSFYCMSVKTWTADVWPDMLIYACVRFACFKRWYLQSALRRPSKFRRPCISDRIFGFRCINLVFVIQHWWSYNKLNFVIFRLDAFRVCCRANTKLKLYFLVIFFWCGLSCEVKDMDIQSRYCRDVYSLVILKIIFLLERVQRYTSRQTSSAFGYE
jgi:hypothetical protein